MNPKPFVRMPGLEDRGISYRNASTWFRGPFHPSPMASRKAPTCRVHINVRARRRSVVNFMPGACYPVPRVGTSSGSALPAPPSGGHVRPGFVGPGFLEDRGEEIGGGRGPAGDQSSSRPFSCEALRCSTSLVRGGRPPSSEVPACLADGHDRLPNEARGEQRRLPEIPCGAHLVQIHPDQVRREDPEY